MKKVFIISILFFTVKCMGQNVGIGTITPNASAVLDIASNNKGVILPRINTVSRLNIVNPAQGLTVFEIDSKSYWYFDGTSWQKLLSSQEEQNVGFGGWGDCGVNFNIGDYNPVADPDGESNDFFGRSVAINGDYAIVGSWQDDDASGVDQGSALIFKRNSNTGQWLFIQKLFNSSPSPQDYFGHSVAIFGDYAMVGANGDDDAAGADQGSVCIFKRNSATEIWEFQQKLLNQTPVADDNFGIALSIYGDYAIIGANRDHNGTAIEQGSATVIKKNPVTGVWEFQQKITNIVPTTGDNFGFAVNIFNEYAIIGADADDDAVALDQGTATIYKRNATTGIWEFQQMLVDSEPALSDRFGISVAINGNYAIVGTYLDDDLGGANQGSASIFKRNPNTNTWTFQQKLFNTNPSSAENFGISVTISDAYAIVGANLDDGISGIDQGSATIYRKVGNFWQKLQFLTDPAGNAGDFFANRVVLDPITNRFAICANRSANNKGKVLFGKIN
jgi:hypothetical protein